MKKIQKFNLRLLPEGYCIVTPSKIFESVMWVDWMDEDGNEVEINLADDTVITGSGDIEVFAIPDTAKNEIDLNDLREFPELDESVEINQG